MKTLLTILFVFLFVLGFAQNDDIRLKHFNTKKSLALEGYDPVSYFDGHPLEGKVEIKFVYKSIEYRFATAINQGKFKTNPEKYEPVYGGWCAYAMGESGEKVKVDPGTYKILEGRLYLFYNFWGNNTLEDWNEKEKKLRESGNRNWAKIAH